MLILNIILNKMELENMFQNFNNMKIDEEIEEIKEINNFECIDNKIKKIEFIYNIENIKIIYIMYHNIKVILKAVNDCLCYSWIEKYNYDFTFLIGKQIKSIERSKNHKLTYDFINDKYNDYECINIHFYEIQFFDTDEIFIFILKNLSNGYYDGNVDILFQLC
jgi:hypothetical protein